MTQNNRKMMIYRNAQFIHLYRFGALKGHQGTLLTFCFIDLSSFYLSNSEFIMNVEVYLIPICDS